MSHAQALAAGQAALETGRTQVREFVTSHPWVALALVGGMLVMWIVSAARLAHASR